MPERLTKFSKLTDTITREEVFKWEVCVPEGLVGCHISRKDALAENTLSTAAASLVSRWPGKNPPEKEDILREMRADVGRL